jgi:DNA (cytosine-5)-methyltransferase 1
VTPESLDLFSCIGCHALGFERAGIGSTMLCEIDEWRRGVLSRNFQGVPIHDDVKTIEAPRSHIVFGGPPCQRTSRIAAVHGYRTGDTLWPHMLKAGLDSGAEWFVVEQPTGNKAWEDAVSRDLSDAGFHVARVEFGACDVGAPYPRRRVYLMACTARSRLEVAWSAVPSEIEHVKRASNARTDWDPSILELIPVAASDAGEMDRGPISAERKRWIEALGDSNPPAMAEVMGRAVMRGIMCHQTTTVVKSDNLSILWFTDPKFAVSRVSWRGGAKSAVVSSTVPMRAAIRILDRRCLPSRVILDDNESRMVHNGS